MKVDLSKAQLGMTRQEVIKALGEEPDDYGSERKMEHATIWVYNGDMELYFHKGCDGTLHTIWQDPDKAPYIRVQNEAWGLQLLFDEEPFEAFAKLAEKLPGGHDRLVALRDTIKAITELDLHPEEKQ
jgi:hypothetical protein